MQSENPMSFFSENVDDWGAAEWFDRAAKAIRSQDKANVKGDDIAFETYRMIAASSLAKLVREHEDTVRAALSTGAEPVAYGVFSKHGDFQFACVSKADAEKEGDWPGDGIRPLYAEPVKTAPAVAVKVKALEWKSYRENGQSARIKAVHPFGEYRIIDNSRDGELWSPELGGINVIFNGWDEAKAAAQADYEARILSALSAQVQEVEETLETYYQRQIEWSRETFGPALRTKGIIDHITKELREIEADPHDLSEWVDVVILAMDGFWRHGGNAEDLFRALIAKQKKNMARSWPDWRTMSEDSAIEHDRSKDVASPASKHGDEE